MPSTVSIVLKRVEIEAHVGVHPWEKFPERPTRLLIDVTLSFDYADYFGRLGGYVSYDAVRSYLKSLKDAPHTERLETLADNILKHTFAVTGAARAHLQILKPDIFNDMDGVGIALDVSRADFERA